MHLGRALRLLAGVLLGFIFAAQQNAWALPLVYVYSQADFLANNSGLLGTSGDFNGDGRPDFAVLSFENNSVSILLGQPDGSFVDTNVIYSVGTNPVAAAVEDFNRDGNPDLVVVCQACPASDPCPPGLVSILLGNGDGTFQAHADYEVAPNALEVAIGDFNNDGRLDLAVAAHLSRISSGSPGMVSTLLGNGDGTFQYHLDSAAGFGVVGLVAADFNGDGFLDVVVDNHPTLSGQTVSLLLGSGDGSFQPPVDIPVGGDPLSLVTGDFNQDARADLAVATGGSNAAILLGNGDGTFQPFVNYSTGFGPFRIVAADMNNDRALDLVVSSVSDIPSNGVISILLGNPDGTFLPRLEYRTGVFGELAIGDFNGDQKMDVAVGNNASTGVSVVLGHGDGTLVHATDYATGRGPAAVAKGDFNGDGYLDLAITNSTCSCPGGTVSILAGNGDGTFRSLGEVPTGNEPAGLATGDFNRDGNLDLAVVNSSDNTVSILLGNGDGTFRPRADFGTGRRPLAVIAQDFNGDQILDLAVTNGQDGSVSILLGNNDGTFAAPVDYAAGPGAAGIVAGDFNLDGAVDLAVADSDTPISFRDPGIVSVLLGNGDGTFRMHLDSFVGSLKPFSVVAADFDGDLVPDLAVATQLSSSFGSVAIMHGIGDGTFQLTTTYASGRFSRGIASADFNIDGKPDLAVANLGSNTVTLFKGQGDGTFQSQSRYGASVGPVGVTFGDFNGDGVPDLAAVNLGSNTVSVFLSGVP